MTGNTLPGVISPIGATSSSTGSDLSRGGIPESPAGFVSPLRRRLRMIPSASSHSSERQVNVNTVIFSISEKKICPVHSSVDAFDLFTNISALPNYSG